MPDALLAPILDDLTVRYESPDLSGTGMTWRDQVVRRHGRASDGLGGRVYPGRRVLELPGRTWPAERPEDCTDDSNQGKWINDQVLVCRGCGLDCT